MIDTSRSFIQTLSVHQLGPGGDGDDLRLSTQPVPLENELIRQLLLTYFLSNFTVPEYHSFGESCATNPVFQAAVNVFNDVGSLHEQSVIIARRLRTVSTQPTIKGGDLFVAYLSGISIEGRLLNGLGIFKSEIKEPYLKVHGESDSFQVRVDNGINIRKLDKGVLILDEDQDLGFKVLLADAAGRSEAAFWKDEFLGLTPTADAFHHTHNFMNLTRQYIDDQMDEEFSVSKADKIDMLNRSMNFFKSRDQFDQREFESEVLADPSVIESFRNYEQVYMTGNDIADNFEISSQAVRRQARVYKSVLKLDKNFHVYIHGNRDLIEKGFDPDRNRHFYKLYFDSES